MGAQSKDLLFPGLRKSRSFDCGGFAAFAQDDGSLDSRVPPDDTQLTIDPVRGHLPLLATTLNKC
jgi:hypothetical protein